MVFTIGISLVNRRGSVSENDLNKIKTSLNPREESRRRRDNVNISPLHWRGRERSQLNANGDRANGTFDYWGVENNNGVYNWYFVGQSQRKRK